MSGQGNDMRRERMTYGIGYASALALTGIAFALVHWHVFSLDWTLGIVFGLALLQILVHFRCFLHITLGRSARADLQLLLFSTLIVSLMVAGTLVVVFNLRSRMM
jgi:cytochrome o ubiquinol oxidase operon protein cyoD